MSGSIRVNNHFFENGNVQFNLDKKYENLALTGSDGDSICQKINEMETAYQTAVEEVLEQTKEGMMKRMRRFIPVSG